METSRCFGSGVEREYPWVQIVEVHCRQTVRQVEEAALVSGALVPGAPTGWNPRARVTSADGPVVRGVQSLPRQTERNIRGCHRTRQLGHLLLDLLDTIIDGLFRFSFFGTSRGLGVALVTSLRACSNRPKV
jgi:hypothetical protein